MRIFNVIPVCRDAVSLPQIDVMCGGSLKDTRTNFFFVFVCCSFSFQSIQLLHHVVSVTRKQG